MMFVHVCVSRGLEVSAPLTVMIVFLLSLCPSHLYSECHHAVFISARSSSMIRLPCFIEVLLSRIHTFASSPHFTVTPSRHRSLKTSSLLYFSFPKKCQNCIFVIRLELLILVSLKNCQLLYLERAQKQQIFSSSNMSSMRC